MEVNLIGLGLRHPHYQHVLEQGSSVDWFEVHSENFMHHGAARRLLMTVRDKYPLSLHGVGLSLGSADGVDKEHLCRLKELVCQLEPFLLSEHLSWSKINQTYYPDLFPLPYHAQSLQIVCDNIDLAQDYLNRTLLIENPSSYIEYTDSIYREVDFLIHVAQRTGAKILLDINNVVVSCHNHHWDPKAYILAIPSHLVAEIHLAGHSIKTLEDGTSLRIDSHDAPVCAEVWDLYAFALQRFHGCPTLLEWDQNIPEFTDLEQEAMKATRYANIAMPI